MRNTLIILAALVAASCSEHAKIPAVEVLKSPICYPHGCPDYPQDTNMMGIRKGLTFADVSAAMSLYSHTIVPTGLHSVALILNYQHMKTDEPLHSRIDFKNGKVVAAQSDIKGFYKGPGQRVVGTYVPYQYY